MPALQQDFPQCGRANSMTFAVLLCAVCPGGAVCAVCLCARVAACPRLCIYGVQLQSMHQRGVLVQRRHAAHRVAGFIAKCTQDRAAPAPTSSFALLARCSVMRASCTAGLRLRGASLVVDGCAVVGDVIGWADWDWARHCVDGRLAAKALEEHAVLLNRVACICRTIAGRRGKQQAGMGCRN